MLEHICLQSDSHIVNWSKVAPRWWETSPSLGNRKTADQNTLYVPCTPKSLEVCNFMQFWDDRSHSRPGDYLLAAVIFLAVVAAVAVVHAVLLREQQDRVERGENLVLLVDVFPCLTVWLIHLFVHNYFDFLIFAIWFDWFDYNLINLMFHDFNLLIKLFVPGLLHVHCVQVRHPGPLLITVTSITQMLTTLPLGFSKRIGSNPKSAFKIGAWRKSMKIRGLFLRLSFVYLFLRNFKGPLVQHSLYVWLIAHCQVIICLYLPAFFLQWEDPGNMKFQFWRLVGCVENWIQHNGEVVPVT